MNDIRNTYFKVNGKGVDFRFSIVWVVHKFCPTNKGIILGKVTNHYTFLCFANIFQFMEKHAWLSSHKGIS